ncbi:hypothetical protein SAMN05216199_1448 [Pedococcus cremeus]|uniref:Uncharacterized protein n=1 Tax=Pedococcus cremeus TaxID=587636 RepID=A0A1H9T5W4_9MICO|nr:hypothetical protein SAMN05216199_1448 [Pedococcus cremeus]
MLVELGPVDRWGWGADGLGVEVGVGWVVGELGLGGDEVGQGQAGWEAGVPAAAQLVPGFGVGVLGVVQVVAQVVRAGVGGEGAAVGGGPDLQ